MPNNSQATPINNVQLQRTAPNSRYSPIKDASKDSGYRQDKTFTNSFYTPLYSDEYKSNPGSATHYMPYSVPYNDARLTQAEAEAYNDTNKEYQKKRAANFAANVNALNPNWRVGSRFYDISAAARHNNVPISSIPADAGLGFNTLAEARHNIEMAAMRAAADQLVGGKDVPTTDLKQFLSGSDRYGSISGNRQRFGIGNDPKNQIAVGDHTFVDGVTAINDINRKKYADIETTRDLNQGYLDREQAFKQAHGRGGFIPVQENPQQPMMKLGDVGFVGSQQNAGNDSGKGLTPIGEAPVNVLPQPPNQTTKLGSMIDMSRYVSPYSDAKTGIESEGLKSPVGKFFNGIGIQTGSSKRAAERAYQDRARHEGYNHDLYKLGLQDQNEQRRWSRDQDRIDQRTDDERSYQDIIRREGYDREDAKWDRGAQDRELDRDVKKSQIERNKRQPQYRPSYHYSTDDQGNVSVFKDGRLEIGSGKGSSKTSKSSSPSEYNIAKDRLSYVQKAKNKAEEDFKDANTDLMGKATYTPKDLDNIKAMAEAKAGVEYDYNTFGRQNGWLRKKLIKTGEIVYFVPQKEGGFKVINELGNQIETEIGSQPTTNKNEGGQKVYPIPQR